MDKDIEIKIRHRYVGITVLFAISLITAIFSFAYMVTCFRYEFYGLSALNAMIFIMSGVLFGLSAVLTDRPTVIRSDGTMLYWLSIYRKHELSLNDIAKTECEPYSVYGRYETSQRIRLTLHTKDGTDIEFNDSVDANDLLNEKLGNKNVDVPILKLYEYLNAQCGKAE